MSEKPRINVQEAFEPELRQGQPDMDAYTNTRPYQDENGRVHHPHTGNFVDADKFFDAQRQDLEQQHIEKAYEEMSMGELAAKLADARSHEDRSTAQEINEVFLDKMKVEDVSMPDVARYLGDAEYAEDEPMVQSISDVLLGKLSEFEEKHHSERDVEHSGERSDQIWDRIMGIKDRHVAQLRQKDQEQEDEVVDGEFVGHALPAAEESPQLTAGNHAIELDEAEVVDGEIVDDDHANDHTSEDSTADEPTQEHEINDDLGTEPTEPMDVPISDPSVGGRRARARDIMGRIGRAIRNAPLLMYVKAQSANDSRREYFNDPEKGTKRSFRAGMVAGALVLTGAGVAYLELKGGSGVSSHHHDIGNTLHHAHKHHHHAEATLREGQNPWSVSDHEEIIHGVAHPTNHQIEDYDRAMAALNPNKYSYFGNSSEHLRTGTKLKLPRFRGR